MESIVYNMDCLEAMRQMPEGAFDLAVCDPPYGIERLKRKKGRLEKYGDTTIANNAVPTQEYFEQLLRVAKKVIVWGGNYFNLPPCRCFLVWYKHQPVSNYSDVEMAWTNINGPAKCFDYPYFGNIGADNVRIHPVQKPVALYSWIYYLFAKNGYKILDTHVGSGSSRIAAYDAGLDFYGYEIDKVFFDKAEKRYKDYISQERMSFPPKSEVEIYQEKLTLF